MIEFTEENFLKRAAFIEAQIKTWKGHEGYIDTLTLEATALRYAAGELAKGGTIGNKAFATMKRIAEKDLFG